MESIIEIFDKDVGIDAPLPKDFPQITRKAARVILFDEKNNVALAHVTKQKRYKIPGGGVDENESLENAAKREAKEESGCSIKIIQELGKSIEKRGLHNFSQESICYFAKVIGQKAEPEFTSKEKEEGFEVLWVSIEKAIELFGTVHDLSYLHMFQHVRDLAFLKRAEEMIRNNTFRP
jgi:8-oxo-dGTP diphosphatase